MVIELIDNLEQALEHAYRHSFSARVVRGTRDGTRALIFCVVHPGDSMIGALLAGAASSCVRWTLDFCARVYGGSVSMNIIERAFLNSRWVRMRDRALNTAKSQNIRKSAKEE